LISWVEFVELANVSGDLGTGFLTTAVNGRRSMAIMLPGRALIQEEVRATVSTTCKQIDRPVACRK
jgi:hypothetical protein